LEQKPPRDALFYPEASWNRYQSDVYALGVAFLLIAFNGREEIKRTLGTAEVAEVVEALGGGAEELKKRLRIMLGVTGERLDFVGLEEVVTGRKRQPPLPKPAPALLPKPSIVLPPKPSFIPFKPSIKKERPSVLPAPPQPLVPAKPSLLPANNDVPQALIPPKPAMNPLVQGIAKPGPEAGQPMSVPSANNESKPAEPRAGLPLTLPKMKFGPQDKLETVPKAPGAEAKPGLPSVPKFGQPFQPLKKPAEGGNDSPVPVNPLSIPKIVPGEEAKPGSLPVKPGLPPAPKFGQPFQPLKKPAEGGNDSPAPVNPLSIPKIVPGEEAKPGSLPVKPGLPPFPYGQPSQPLKKPEEGGNDSPANPPLANPLTIPKIGPPKVPVPASPYSVPKTCAKCKSPLSGDVCLICTAVKSNSPAEAPPKSGPFPPKQGTAGLPVPGGNRVPAVAPVPQPPGQRDLITKATDAKKCTCKNCGSQFRKKFSASPDYDKQFEEYCSEDCAFAYAASQ